MNVLHESVARSFALVRQKPVPIRKTASIAPDPIPAFGIAVIKVVADDYIQAIAYGDVRRRPRILVRLDPLGRESRDFRPFARALDRYLHETLAAGQLPRIWVPHAETLKLLGLLGHRYRTNREAPPTIRKMGALCRALAEEAAYPGQQVIAVARDLLVEHAVTGQSAMRDNHLGALLAWHEPIRALPPRVNAVQRDPSVPPSVEADKRALVPAAAILVRDDDDAVEKLRAVAKNDPDLRVREHARAEIVKLLDWGVRAEWGLLVRARLAFRALGLPSVPNIAELVEESRERLEYALQKDLNAPSRANSLARLLDAQEYAAELEESVLARGDQFYRERLRDAGRAIAATVVNCNQSRPGFRPCTLILHTGQPVLRVRVGTALLCTGTNVRGRVTAVRPVGTSGVTEIEIEILAGFRSRAVFVVNSQGDWIDTVLVDMRFRRQNAYGTLRDANPPAVYGQALPTARPRHIGSADLLQVVRQLRRP